MEKLKELENIIDGCTKVRIWTQNDDDDTPSFEGYFMDIPWRLMDCRVDMSRQEEPIWITIEKNQHDVYIPIIIISVFED